ELIRLAILTRRRDVEGAHLRAAECAHGRTHRRQRVFGEALASRRQSHDLAAAIERNPVTAVAVDRRAVGPFGLPVETREFALAADGARDFVECIRID